MHILITGGFDPLHSGHIRLFKEASKIGNLVVGLNSDKYIIRKKGAVLLPLEERVSIISSVSYVFSVIYDFNDDDNSSCDAITTFIAKYGNSKKPLIFANGGDRTADQANKKEVDLCNSLGIFQLYGVGGTKSTSSSKLLSNYVESLKN